MSHMHALLHCAASLARSVAASVQLLGRGFTLVARTAPLVVAAYALLVLLFSLLPVLQVWLSKLVIDALASGAAIAVLSMLVVPYIAALVIKAGLHPLQRSLGSWLETHGVAAVDHILMRTGIRMTDLWRVERPAFQDELKLLEDMPHLLPRLFPAIESVLGGAITLAGLLVLLAGLEPLLPLLLVLTAIPHLIVERRTHSLMYSTMERLSRAGREMDYCVRLTTEPAAAKEVRVFGLGDFFLDRFRTRFADAYAEIRSIRLRHLARASLLVGLFALVLGGGFWYVAIQADAGRLTVGDVALYTIAIAQAQSFFRLLTLRFSDLYQTHLYLRRFFSFVDGASPAIELAHERSSRGCPVQLTTGIEFRQVSFAYPESSQPVLTDVSALLPAGKVTALVGENGAGKSTLVKLLTRMYDPQTGQIFLDGIPLATYDLNVLRRRLAVMYQDFARFALKLRENIAVGAPSPGASNGRVEDAARWAGADKIVAKLARGYDTELTRRFEGGVELSGGEWQKVALARGFMRDAALVILDEPTSALDADAEHQLFEHFRELIAGKTGLIISHRFSTVRMADQIIMLDSGRIIEAGSHAELVRRGGRYAQLFKMQAELYRDDPLTTGA